MTTTQQHPAQFDWATELLDAQGHVTLSAKEAHEIGARLRSMGAKLKSYEDLGDATNDMQLLRMGYAAARLEIESLHAQLEAIGAGGVSGPLVGRASLQSPGFDAADMATASAQGFRDGVASLSANAGEREPLTHAQAKALVLKYGNDPLHLVYQVEVAHGIKGGQHGTE